MRSPVAFRLALLALLFAGCGSPEGDPLEVTVPMGSSLSQITDSLAARQVVDRPLLFRLYVRLQGEQDGLRAGTYAFRRGESWSRIVSSLRRGEAVTRRMTVPEGFTIQRMIPRIAAVVESPEDSVRRRLEADSLAVRYDVPGPGLEGYLFPDTYLFAPGTPLERVLQAMTERYHAFWTPERRARLDRLELTERELVTLASIVQAEARIVEEMPRIAGVYWNRLERSYPLQADPTVLYALGGPRERLLYAAIDSVADSPYNTYAHPGLPPGPIGAPGEAALDAALDPADTDAFYFVARPNGEHVFTRTLSEHNRAKAQARREWDTARSSAGTRPPPEDTGGAGTDGE